jgi:hypothetical protein
MWWCNFADRLPHTSEHPKTLDDVIFNRVYTEVVHTIWYKTSLMSQALDDAQG